MIEGLGPQPFRNPQAVYNAHIQLVLRQQALDFVGVGHQGPQPHLWVFLTEAPQNLGQARLAKADVCPHPQGQGPPLAQGFLRLLEPPQHVLSRGKQGLPGRGQVDAAIHALEKGHAIMAFQLFNSQAHSGLGGIKGLCCLAEIEEAAHFHKNGEMFPGHRYLLRLLYGI